jgi:hypothetical protein
MVKTLIKSLIILTSLNLYADIYVSEEEEAFPILEVEEGRAKENPSENYNSLKDRVIVIDRIEDLYKLESIETGGKVKIDLSILKPQEHKIYGSKIEYPEENKYLFKKKDDDIPFYKKYPYPEIKKAIKALKKKKISWTWNY